MRRLVFCALVIFASTSAADKLSSAGLAVDPLCSGGYEAIAKQVANLVEPKPYLAALKKEFPQIQDPENFAALYRQRLAVWRAANPGVGRLPNVPMPENKPAVDWLRATLINLRNDPYYRYPDEETRKLTQAARVKQTAKLLAEVRRIERTGYGTRDVTAIASDTFEFLGLIDRDPPDVDDIVKILNEKFQIDIQFSQEESRRLFDLRRKSHVELAVGERALELDRTYELALIESIKKHMPIGTPKIDVADVVRRHKYRFGFTPEPRFNLVGTSLARRALSADRPTIFVNGETPVRALAEATIYEIQIGGFIDRPTYADEEIMSASRYLQHDLNHMRAPSDDPISKTLVGLDSRKKRELFMRIDAIPDLRKRALSEYALLAALREFQGDSGTLFSSAIPEATWIVNTQRVFRKLGENNLSDEEARWVINWCKENLPVN